MKVRKGGGEEIPLLQGKEQWLRFAGAAMKSESALPIKWPKYWSFSFSISLS